MSDLVAESNYVTLLQSLSHCELITDDGIGQLGGGLCAAESLTVLELDNCPLITDASLTHLSGCQSLRRIELYDCQLITRAGIHKLKAILFDMMCHFRISHLVLLCIKYI